MNCRQLDNRIHLDTCIKTQGQNKEEIKRVTDNKERKYDGNHLHQTRAMHRLGPVTPVVLLATTTYKIAIAVKMASKAVK